MISSVFWLNRIRKDYKDEPAYLLFCDTMKPIFTGLIDYVNTYHSIGLTFNPKGISLAEAAIRYTDEINQDVSPAAADGAGVGAGAAGTGTTGGNLEVEPATTTAATVTASLNEGGTTSSPKRTGPHPTLGSNVIVGGNVAGIIGELGKRTNADGTSAATGLKHVRGRIGACRFCCCSGSCLIVIHIS